MSDQAMAMLSSAEILHWMTSVENSTDAIIESLPHRSDEEVIEIRQQARCIGRTAWRIECAADAEIMNRVSARQGRLKDVEGRGVHAAVVKAASAAGVDPSTVYQNASIHKTFFASLSSQRNKEYVGAVDVLDDKAFYQAALATDDPHAALEQFAQAKTANPLFNTRDAWRQVKESKTPSLDDTVPALLDQPEIIKAWEDYQIATQKLKEAAPRITSLLNGYLEEIQYELSVPEQTIKEAIFRLIEQGLDELDQIAQSLKKDRVHVNVWLNRMLEVGELERIDKPRVPGARGQARHGYVIL